MKRYKLLKDLPDLKAGAIFEFSGPEYISKNNLDLPDTYYSKLLVESTPEWFEELKEGVKHPIDYFRESVLSTEKSGQGKIGDGVDISIRAINTAMIDAYNQAIEDISSLQGPGLCMVTITLKKPKDFKF